MNREEEALHLATAHFLRVALPPDWIWTSIEPGGHRLGKAEAGKRKARGVLPGWPDIQILPPLQAFPESGGVPVLITFPVILIELKSPKGRLSKAQRDLHPRLLSAGYDLCVARSVEDVERFLRACGVPLRGTTGARA